MSEKDANELVSTYTEACGSHCEPIIVIERLTSFDFNWDDQSLSELIYLKTKQLGIIPSEWVSVESNQGKSILRSMLGEPTLEERPPFSSKSKTELNNYLEKLYDLIGDGVFLTNVVFYTQSSNLSSKSYKSIFPENDKYLIDIGVAIITGGWFAFFAHRVVG